MARSRRQQSGARCTARQASKDDRIVAVGSFTAEKVHQSVNHISAPVGQRYDQIKNPVPALSSRVIGLSSWNESGQAAGLSSYPRTCVHNPDLISPQAVQTPRQSAPGLTRVRISPSATPEDSFFRSISSASMLSSTAPLLSTAEEQGAVEARSRAWSKAGQKPSLPSSPDPDPATRLPHLCSWLPPHPWSRAWGK
jgi:hypothetical protein